MFAIELNNNKFVVGLKWSRLAGEKVGAELSALSKEAEMYFGFTRKLEEEEGQFVYQSALSSEKSVNGMISAAAVVADLVENIILIEKVDDEKYWICCVNDSEVVPGGDELIDFDLLTDKFHQLQSLIGEEELRVCIHESASDLFSAKSEAIQFADILEENEIKKPLKDFSHYKVKSLKGVPVAGVLFGAFALILGGGAFFMTQNSGPVIVDIEPIKLPEVQIKKPDPTEKVDKKKIPTEAELFADAKNEEITWMKERFIKEDPHQIINAISDFTYGLPRFFAGWSSSQVVYDSKRPDIITVIWTRNDLGTALSLQNSIKNHIGINFSLDGQSARTTHEITGLQEKTVDEDLISSIQNDKYKTAEFMHDVESLNLNWSVELLSQDGPRRQKIVGIKNERDAFQKQLKLLGKYFTVRGGRLNSMYVFNDIFTKSKSSLIDKININLNENNWTVNGTLYEK